MNLSVIDTAIPEVKILEPAIFRDHRGFFTEAFHREKVAAAGIELNVAQLNHSGSVQNVVRGLHFQWDPPMAKLMRVIRGEAFLVAVDIRHGSPTLGRYASVTASSENGRQLYAPASFARGFAVLSEYAEIEYLTSGQYNPHGESGIRWDDPEIGIDWPVAEPILSDKDRNAQTLQQWLARDESKAFRA